MPPFLLPFAFIFLLFRELWALLKNPHFRSLLFWVLVILLAGTVFYARVEGWSILNAFYFSVITLLTVGYGDLVPTTNLGKMFTVGYLIFGMSIVLAFVTTLAKEREQIHARRFGGGNEGSQQ